MAGIFGGFGRRNKSERGDTEMNTYMGKWYMGGERELKKAKETIKKIHYLTLASVCRKSLPWCSPLFCAYDKDYNFYWISSQHCVHSYNIRDRNGVAFVIYDSTVPEGKGFGVYVKAKAYVVSEKAEINKGLKLIYERKGKPVPHIELFTGNAPRRVYKAVPIAFWINDIAAKEEEFKNIRMEIQLK